MQIDDNLRRVAAQQHQLITRQAWADTGRTSRSFDRAVEAGLLVRVDRGVAALAGTEITPERRIHAAVIATAQPCLVSHRSGAFVWGAPVPGIDPVDLLSVERSGRPRRGGVVVHRPVDLRRVHAAHERGFQVTTPLRTLVDLGAVAPEFVSATLTSMLIRGLVTVSSARQAVEQHGKRGRPGVAALRDAIDELPLGSKPPDSVLEPMMARLLGRAGVTGWTFHGRACGFELDFAFEREQVDVEVDGWRWHRERFEADAARDAVLVAAGWVVVRFTWRQVTRRPGWVASIIADALTQRTRAR